VFLIISASAYGHVSAEVVRHLSSFPNAVLLCKLAPYHFFSCFILSFWREERFNSNKAHPLSASTDITQHRLATRGRDKTEAESLQTIVMSYMTQSYFGEMLLLLYYLSLSFSLSANDCIQLRRKDWVFLERTRVLNGIQCTRYLVKFDLAETNVFVGSNPNEILMRQKYGKCSSMPWWLREAHGES